MTKSLPSALQAALEAGTIVPRDFLWLTARNRTTGDPVTWGAWSDRGSVTAQVLNPFTGETVARDFEGAGSLVEIGRFSMVAGLAVQAIDINLSLLSDAAMTLLFGNDLRRAPVELYRGFLDPATNRLVAPAHPRFVGFVDEGPLEVPPIDEDGQGSGGGIKLTVASQTQDLMRSSSATRSDADQRRRNPDDGFFRHAATVGSWTIWWGQAKE